MTFHVGAIKNLGLCSFELAKSREVKSLAEAETAMRELPNRDMPALGWYVDKHFVNYNVFCASIQSS